MGPQAKWTREEEEGADEELSGKRTNFVLLNQCRSFDIVNHNIFPEYVTVMLDLI